MWELSASHTNVRVVGYERNRGRGAALRAGFEAASGRVVATVDFDLSYTPDHILRMYEILHDRPEADVVLASAYMPGGAVEGVPAGRLFASRLGNLILRFAFHGLYTTTCIVRAYRREVLDTLALESERKEIHLEILSKALALGFNVVEMPATLRGRAKGRSKFRLGGTIISHLAFVVREEPMLVVAGLFVLFTLGGLAGLALVALLADTAGVSAKIGVLKVLVALGIGYVLTGGSALGAWAYKRTRRRIIRLESRQHLMQRALVEKKKSREN
ncbi:MAG: glycosyltransferase [Planctomycetota bacterium]